MAFDERVKQANVVRKGSKQKSLLRIFAGRLRIADGTDKILGFN